MSYLFSNNLNKFSHLEKESSLQQLRLNGQYLSANQI